jgi:hypothetical protein
MALGGPKFRVQELHFALVQILANYLKLKAFAFGTPGATFFLFPSSE